MTNTNHRLLFAWSLLAVAAVFGALSAGASSHREAPGILSSPQIDGTDFYMFRSYEEGRDGFVTLIADYNPLQDPYGGPNYFSLDPEARYRVNIENDGDLNGSEDIVFEFQFFNTLNTPTVSVGGQDVAHPLRTITPLAGGITPNEDELYTVRVIRGDDPPQFATNGTSGDTFFVKALDYFGEKTFADYDVYASDRIAPIQIPGCDDGRVFVGQRKEPFAANLGEIFDLINLNPVGGNRDEKPSSTQGKNITSLVLEVPTDCLTGGGSGIIGGWTTAHLPRNRTLTDDPTLADPDQQSGDLVQVSRLGNPLVNEVAIGLPDKNLFNAAHPRDDDANFLNYVTNPTLPAIIQALFGAQAPTNFPREDLEWMLLTGIPGVNEDGSMGEILRLNTNIPPTPMDEQNNLGVAGGDMAGYPNGRRPGDDVMDIALRVIMGNLQHLGLGGGPPSQDIFVNGDIGNCTGRVNANVTQIQNLNCNTQNFPGIFRAQIFNTATGQNIANDAGPIFWRNVNIPPPCQGDNFPGCTGVRFFNQQNQNGAVVGPILQAIGGGIFDPGDALDGLLPYTDQTYQGPDQFDDAFPYLRSPCPGAGSQPRTANMLSDWLDPLGSGNDGLRGLAPLLRTGSDDEITFLFEWSINLLTPNTLRVTENGPDGSVLWEVENDGTGPGEAILNEDNFMGDDLDIFTDGFESGDTTVWSSVTPGGSGQSKEAGRRVEQQALVIAGPFR